MNRDPHFDAFISYKWDIHKDKVHNMANELKKNKLKIWLDLDQMKESTDLSTTMQSGIDNSHLFICCVAETYCDFENPNNKNCKSEFNYAFATNKTIIYVIFSDTTGLREAEIVKKFKAVGFRMSGHLYYRYPTDLESILDAIMNKRKIM
jgi:hypothetical protein